MIVAVMSMAFDDKHAEKTGFDNLVVIKALLVRFYNYYSYSDDECLYRQGGWWYKTLLHTTAHRGQRRRYFATPVYQSCTTKSHDGRL